MPSLRRSLLGVPPRLDKSYDQTVLDSVVWPTIRDQAAIHDSYHCLEVGRYGDCRPWPTRRHMDRYVGYGPTKAGSVDSPLYFMDWTKKF